MPSAVLAAADDARCWTVPPVCRRLRDARIGARIGPVTHVRHHCEVRRRSCRTGE
ncbi:hypothetical protein [Streptomyces sp. B6B3]|uniref:hypothetical protein n=1 Tax=Streptomyces sp. B6B3 TaxID=3153570 RepID=UPI00325CEFD7